MVKLPGMLALAVALSWSATARAYINGGNSVEWLATFRPVIVEAKVTAVDDRTEKASNNVTFRTAKLTCDVTTVHKGKLTGPVTFGFGAYEKDAEMGNVGTTYLLFLDVEEETGKMVVRDFVNLDAPGKRFVPAVAYNKAGKILLTKGEILGTLTDRLKILEKSPVPDFQSFAPTAADTLKISAPGEAATSLWAGSATFLRVPPDPEFEALFLPGAQQGVAGVKQADAVTGGILFPLAFYSDDKANEVMRAALQDSHRLHVALFAQDESNTPAQELTVYPLRQAAYEILKARGEKKLDVPAGMTPYFRMGSNGGGMIMRYRAPGAKRDLYVAKETLEAATQPAP